MSSEAVNQVEQEQPAASVMISDDQLANMKIPELKTELRRRQLRVSGKKRELVGRLRAALTLEREHGAREDDDEDEDEDEDVEDDEDGAAGADSKDCTEDEDEDEGEVRAMTVRSRRGRRTPPRTLLTFRDVEESLEKFSGDDNMSVKRWIEDFEEMAGMCEWTDVQKVAYGRRLLKGSAKLFVNYEKCTKTWAKLKKALKEEFDDVIDSHQIHRELAQRKKKSDETYQQYIYKMIEIAAQADVDTPSVIQYIIQGIPDDATNKALLYGARNIRQLKEKFVQYEASKREMKLKAKTNDQKDGKVKRIDRKDFKKMTTEGDSTGTSLRCYNCGEKDHIGAKCPFKGKGAKCFKCNEFGHIAMKCPANSKESYIVSRPNKKKYVKELTIEDHKFVALVDTGSDLTFIRSDEYERMGSPTLRNRKLKFEGLGSTGNMTMGEFSKNVIIDDNEFFVVFHVVPNTILKHGLLLGTDFLDQVELRVRRGVVSFFKINELEVENANLPEVLRIDAISESDEVDLSYLRGQSYRDEVESMIESYKPEKTRDVGIKTKIILKSDVPVVSRPRRLSPQEKEEVDGIMKTWVGEGVIQPSNSEYASPIVLVKKKDGSTRVCIDYRELNKQILKPHFPLPLIDDQLDALQGAEVFTTLDLKNGFFHVPMAEESRKYTAYVTPTAQYEFLKTPFGLCVSPIVFQKFIVTVFKDLIEKRFVVTYMDDLIVLANGMDEAVCRLKTVLEVAGQHGLIINWQKCRFLQKEIEYLGHIVSRDTIRPSENKTKAVTNFPMPTGVKRVQSFLGLTGYFRKFIRGYSKIARPLTELLKKDETFRFGEREIEAFESLKAALTSKPVLRLYRVGAKTELHTDASQFGYGAILMQMDSEDGKYHPVYFASGKTTQAEEKYSSYELEVLAIVKALRKFRVYLLGIPFKIITDCKAFEMTMRKKDLCVRVARWALLLEEFAYEVVHRPGKSMQHVDALSRNPLPSALLITESEDDMISRLKSAQCSDKDLSKIVDAAMRNKADGYLMRNGKFYKDVSDDVLVVVPKCMQTQVVRQAHERGHFGVNKTETVVKKDFWFKGMRQRVEQVVASCLNCILAEKRQGRQEGFLHPISKGSVPLDTYHIDHIGPMSATKKKYQHILVVVDAFTKFVWLYTTKSTDAAEVIDRLRKQSVIFGNPRRIISDRGTAFTSNAFKEYCQEDKIEHTTIVTGVPRGNGQVERVNRTLIPLLTKLTAPVPEEWYKHVETAQKYLNTTPNRSTGRAPFHLLFGVNARMQEDEQVRELLEQEWIAQFEEERDELWEETKGKIAKAQEENRRGFNKRRKSPRQYREGDLVAIKRTQFGAGLKLKAKFFGPYKIAKVLRNDRYVVEKLGEHEGPKQTSTSVDHMKPWIAGATEETVDSEEENGHNI